MLRPVTIENFINGGCEDLAEATRATYRSRLTQMAKRLLPYEDRVFERLPLSSANNVPVPFSGVEVERLRFWAAHQKTEYRRLNAHLLLALGLGAGLSTQEIIDVTTGDIAVDHEGVLVFVHGARTRAVPVLAVWEEILALVAQTAMRTDIHVFAARRHSPSNPNLVNAFLGDALTPPVHLTAQRMRSTWIVGHLASGVPAPLLARAAGVVRVDSLARYLQFVPEPTHEDGRAALRGHGCVSGEVSQ